MNKNFWKRFLTWNPHHNDGFTLVELIVVIAILAILAAVAVPAYSGYIEKAKRAADLTLLSAVNGAFAAACVSGGSDWTLVTGAALDMTGGTINGLSGVKVGVGTINDAAVTEAFDMLFVAENPGTKFEVITPVYVAGFGFMDKAEAPADSTYFVGYGGGMLALNADSVNAVAGSLLASAGVDVLMKQTESITTWAADGGLIGTAGEAFWKSCAGYLGLPDTATEDEVTEKMLELAGGDEVLASKIGANTIAIYAAENSANLTTESVDQWLGKDITDIQQNASGASLSEAAAIYGLYMSYKGDDFDESVPVLNVMKEAMADGDFKTWVNGDTGKAELDAFKGAMDMINTSTEDTQAMNSVLVNGFGDDDLIAVMQGVIGQ